jgi:PAS domain-containing protein
MPSKVRGQREFFQRFLVYDDRRTQPGMRRLEGGRSMDLSKMYILPEFGPIIGVLDALLSELNLGLFIYHLGVADDEKTLRLVYANREAARSTGLDVDKRLGKFIHEAFPPLAETDLPQTFMEVVMTQTSRRIEVPYAEEGETVHYSVRAFPMPANCMGVLFERQGEPEETVGPD